ncbi:TPA: hypothetical protein ACH3M6_004398, partial [Klebsiella pneumoniae]
AGNAPFFPSTSSRREIQKRAESHPGNLRETARKFSGNGGGRLIGKICIEGDARIVASWWT